MADIYVIGPDGFVTTRPASYNPDGSIRLSGSNSSYSPYSRSTSRRSSGKSVTSSSVSVHRSTAPQKKAKSYNSTAEINKLFESWKSAKVITEKAVKRALSKIKGLYYKQYFEKTLGELEAIGSIAIKNESGSGRGVSISETLEKTKKITSSRVPKTIVSIREVNELLDKINIHNSSAISEAKERMTSFALRDYFDKKIAERIAERNQNATSFTKYRKREDVNRNKLVKVNPSNSPKQKPISTVIEPDVVHPKNEITTIEEIDRLVNSWISCNGKITEKAIKKAKSRITSKAMINYLDKRILEYRDSIGKSFEKRCTSGSTTQISKHEADNEDIDLIVPGPHGGRKPKYGYARDIFGRIQERDHYVEDKPVNKYNSSSSLYDSEDDNDSIYENSFDYD